MYVIVSLLVVALMIFALVDIITRDDSQVRYLPKMVWLILVILLPFIGSVLWFGIGREYSGGVEMPRMPRRERRPRAGGPVQAVPPRPVDTRTTEQQIEDLDREIEEWRLRAELEKRKKERGEA